MTQLDTNFFDYSILIIYFALVITIVLIVFRRSLDTKDIYV